MKPKLARLLSAAVAAAALGSSAYAADFLCENPHGCRAKRFENGNVIEAKFRYGDMVSTEAGWVVHSEDGWNEI
jgi:hypothetical protein